jgi:hypothetical protein
MLVARLHLLWQISGFESGHLSKIQNGRHEQRRSGPGKKYTKNEINYIKVKLKTNCTMLLLGVYLPCVLACFSKVAPNEQNRAQPWLITGQIQKTLRNKKGTNRPKNHLTLLSL